MYTCAFKSKYFRRIDFETDFVTQVTPFQSPRGLLPSGGPGRALTGPIAYEGAKIEMTDIGWGVVGGGGRRTVLDRRPVRTPRVSAMARESKGAA